MGGLLLKDLLNLKKQAVAYIAVTAFYTAMAFANGNFSFLGWMLLLLSAMMPITAITFDERAQWDKYALTMPVSRKDMVISKYALGYLLIAVSIVLYVILSGVCGNDVLSTESLLTYLAMACTGVFFVSLLLPIVIKFGSEKGRIYMMATFLVPVLIVMLLAKSGAKAPSEELMKRMTYIAPIIVIAIALLSMLLSLHIYQKKEL